MILYRCFAWEERAAARGPNGPLWFPREYQGGGRHDNPLDYGCLYLTDRGVAGIVEQLAPLRSRRLVPGSLIRFGLPLALAEIEIADEKRLIDLDEPLVLDANGLRPSVVATRRRDVTQPQALDLYRRDPDVAGLRWWSTFESLWANVTLFDRASAALRVRACSRLRLDDDVVLEAAALLGL